MGELPAAFDALRAEARDEGYRFLDRLADEWASGAVRFDQREEMLLTVCAGHVLAGIGGLTRDPVMVSALRMRRFYVSAAFRRQGVGRMLAVALLKQAATAGRSVTVNAGTVDAPAFWTALGFIPDLRDGHTHILDPSQFR